MPPEARAEADNQLRRLEQMNADCAEAGVLRTYLEWLVELPWVVATDDKLDLAEARSILDEDHYGLEDVKDRILEHLGVLKLTRERGRVEKGPILCFVGPPGVGKTSLGRSIARALGRKFVRMSLGGVRDEAEIRGHRRTYVGAMPGRVIQGMKQAGTINPVFLLDEIDKLGADFRGDPSAALLEVLDPEQNGTFRDHYLGVAYDLSKVLFIATANVADPIPKALRDRMEMIRLAGYSEEEKLEITRRHVLPRQLMATGLDDESLKLSDAALRLIITDYTREAGLRDLERQIARIARKVARQHGRGSRGGQEDGARERDAGEACASSSGRRMAPHLDRSAGVDEVGAATGLAWTPYGGEVLEVEAQWMPGKGSLILTGQLGDVMKESAMTALSYARARAASLGLKEGFYAEREIHIHVPAGAVPEGRAVGGRDHGLRAGVAPHRAAGAARRGDDRRDHAARARAARRRAQGEAARGGARRHRRRRSCRPTTRAISSSCRKRRCAGCASCWRARWTTCSARRSSRPRAASYESRVRAGGNRGVHGSGRFSASRNRDQARLLRTGAVGQDDQPAADPRAHGRQAARPPAHARYQGGPHALLRPLAAGVQVDRRA